LQFFSFVIRGEAKHRPRIQGKCFKTCIQADRGSGSRIKSGMTKEILIQQALEFENIVVEFPVL